MISLHRLVLVSGHLSVGEKRMTGNLKFRKLKMLSCKARERTSPAGTAGEVFVSE
jgi:hypothetical protein